MCVRYIDQVLVVLQHGREGVQVPVSLSPHPPHLLHLPLHPPPCPAVRAQRRQPHLQSTRHDVISLRMRDGMCVRARETEGRGQRVSRRVKMGSIETRLDTRSSYIHKAPQLSQPIHKTCTRLCSSISKQTIIHTI